MFKQKLSRILTALLVSVAAVSPALADHGRYGPGMHGWHGDIGGFERHDLGRWRAGMWRHGWHEGHLGWWWIVGGVWYFYPQPVYPYPDPYQPPAVVVERQVVVPAPAVSPLPAPTPAPTAPAAPAATPVWYFCDSAQAYYPYVATCPGGWKTVPAMPPQGAR